MVDSLLGQISSSLLYWKGFDWFFTSNSWTEKFPHTVVRTLVMETSDHWSCVIEIATTIPQAQIFRFENQWLSHEEFMPIVVNGWKGPLHTVDSAKALTAKFKNLRKELKI